MIKKTLDKSALLHDDEQFILNPNQSEKSSHVIIVTATRPYTTALIEFFFFGRKPCVNLTEEDKEAIRKLCYEQHDTLKMDHENALIYPDIPDISFAFEDA